MARALRKGPSKSKDSKSNFHKPTTNEITEISVGALHEARKDPQVGEFLRGAKERGEQFHRDGLIHR